MDMKEGNLIFGLLGWVMRITVKDDAMLFVSAF